MHSGGSPPTKPRQRGPPRPPPSTATAPPSTPSRRAQPPQPPSLLAPETLARGHGDRARDPSPPKARQGNGRRRQPKLEVCSFSTVARRERFRFCVAAPTLLSPTPWKVLSFSLVHLHSLFD